MIIRLTIASIDGEDFTVASVGSHCNVAPTEVIRCKVIQNIKISARPLNGTENLRVFTLLLSERLVHMLLHGINFSIAKQTTQYK